MKFKDLTSFTCFSSEIQQMWAPFGELLGIRYFGFQLYNLCDGRYGFLTSDPSIPLYYISELLYPTQEEALQLLNKYPLFVISPILNSSVKGLSKLKQQRYIKMAVDFHLSYHLGFGRREGNWMKIMGYGIDDVQKDGLDILHRQMTWLKTINDNMDELITPFLARIQKRMITLPDYEPDNLKLLDISETHLKYIQLMQLMKKIYRLSDREFECLRLTVFGESAKLIARKLNISPRTVEIFVENLKQKLNVPNKIALCEKYFRCFGMMKHKIDDSTH